ncbi:MAG: hypothetical protein WC389_19790 [Lutibacter sp.]|jgi:hypothetical protein
MGNVLKISAINSDKGYYISDCFDDRWHQTELDHKLFDGVKCEPTFHPSWRFIKTLPQKVSHFERQPNINYRFILKDDSLNNKLPLELKREDAGEFVKNCEDNLTFIWKDEYAMYRSLYEEVSDPQPEKEVEDAFEFNVLFSVREIKPPPDFKYDIIPHWNTKQFTTLDKTSIIHQQLDKIIFPDLLLHETPCMLSSEDVFKIIRKFVQDNIDPRVAKITSNYEFHFAVAKRIPITKPYETKSSYKPRYKRKTEVRYQTISEKDHEILNIVYKGQQSYGNSTVVQPLIANNENELKEKLDDYLKNLISLINEPVKECPTCLGVGVIFDANKVNNKINERY